MKHGLIAAVIALCAVWMVACAGPKKKEAAATVGPAPLELSLLAPSQARTAQAEEMAVFGRVVGGAAKVQVSFGGASRELTLADDGTFYGTVPVGADGELVITAEGAGGARGEFRRAVVLGPPIVIENVSAVNLTPLSTLTLSGRFPGRIRGANAEGEPVVLDENKFRHVLTLMDEGPQLIRIGGEEIGAAPVERALVFVLDRTPSVVQVSGYAAHTNAPKATLSLHSDERLARLEVLGRAVTLDASGTGSALVALAPGANSIAVTSEDSAGNVGVQAIEIQRDERPPALLLCTPTGAQRAEPLALACTADEPLSAGRIGGVVATVDGARFEAALAGLPEGAQTLELSLTDLAGNSAKGAYEVVIDRTAPLLELLEPEGRESTLTTFSVCGRTEPGAIVTINGERVPAFAGLFSRRYRREAGGYPFKIEASDAAGNVSVLEVEIESNDDPKLFLRQTGRDAPAGWSARGSLKQPEPGGAYAGRIPFRLEQVEARRVSVILNNAAILHDARVPSRGTDSDPLVTLTDELDGEMLMEGTNNLQVILSGMHGEQDTIGISFRVDRIAPQVRWLNLLGGESRAAFAPQIEVTDAGATSVRMELDGAKLPARSTLSAATHGAGPHELCVSARDTAGNETRSCRHFSLETAPFAARRSGDARVSADAPVRKGLVDPMLADLVNSGLLGDLLLGNLMVIVDAAEEFYPELTADLSILRAVLTEQARAGELGALLRGFVVFQRRGWWPDIELLGEEMLRPDRAGRAPLVDLIDAVAEFLPARANEAEALDRLLRTPISGNMRPFDTLIVLMQEIAGLDSVAWEGLLSWMADATTGAFPTELSRLAAVLGTPEADGLTRLEKLEPVAAALLGEGVTGERSAVRYLMDAYLEATSGISNTRDREAFQKTARLIIATVTDPEFLRALGRLLDRQDLQASQEWLRRSIDQGDLPQILRMLSSAALKQNPRRRDELVLAASLRALSQLWQPDKRDPGHTYAGTAVASLGKFFEKGEDGLSTIDDVMEFLSNTNELDRRRLGLVFVQHSVPGQRPKDPFAEGLSTDAERLMRLFKFANSPLNCGAPVPFTKTVVPLNVPGLPMLFPTDNLVTELMEASTAFDPDTVIQLARLMPKLAKIIRVSGDVFCEPEIVGDLLSDVDVLEANLDHPLLPDLLRLARRMVLRGHHHAAVRLLTAVADADVLAESIPFLATIYLDNSAEEFFKFIDRQKSWTLRGRPGVSAYAYSLEVGGVILSADEDGHKPLADLIDRMGPWFSDAQHSHMMRVMQSLGQRMAMNEREPGLGRLDLVVARVLAADPLARGAGELKLLLDGDVANGDLVSVVKALPQGSESGEYLLQVLPLLARRLERRGQIDAGLAFFSNYLRINRQSGGGLRWVARNAFAPAPRGSPLRLTMGALHPVFAHFEGRQSLWRGWAGTNTVQPLLPLFESVRAWTRARPGGAPHLIRVRPLFVSLANLPAPGGEGRMADRAVAIARRANERGFGRTIMETLDLLETRGYLDRRDPSLLDWLAGGSPARNP